MKHFALYESDGRIVGVRSTGSLARAQSGLDPGVSAVEVSETLPDGGKDFMVDNGSVVERPSMGVSVSSHAVTTNEDVVITGVPAGTTVLHPDGEDVGNDGSVEWSSTVQGRVLLRLRNFPYKDEDIQVEVTP